MWWDGWIFEKHKLLKKRSGICKFRQDANPKWEGDPTWGWYGSLNSLL